MIPATVSTLQALLTPAIAVAVAIVAFMQLHLARQKLALDLFDKRMNIYLSLIDAAKHALNKPGQDAIVDFVRAERDAGFLFGDEIIEYLEGAERGIVDLVGITAEVNSMPPGQQRSELSREGRKSKDCVLAFLKEFPIRLQPYMRMDQRLPTKRWP